MAPKENRYINRKNILLVIIFYASVASIAYFIQKATINYTFDYGVISNNEVSRYASRFLEVKKMLPSIQRVGYIDDKRGNLSFTDQSRRMTLTQYILAPYVSYSGANCRFFLSDFHSPINLQQYAVKNNLTLIKDFGDGVALFEKGQ